MSVNKKILFISHHKDVELGSMKNFFIEYKFDFDIIKPLHGETLPSNLEKWRGVIILGGAMNVGDLVEYPKLMIEDQEVTVPNQTGRLNLLEGIDNLSYRAISFGFPLLTIGIIAGAVWANEAWGSYWSWDPKETWALITWLIFEEGNNNE